MTLVLLHSSGATSAVWERVRGHLSGIPVLAPDLPGRGAAGGRARDVPEHAAAILRLLDKAGIERAAVAGHSLGGAVALWLALQWPSRVAGLGLVSTGGRLRVLPQVLEALPDGFGGLLGPLVDANCGAGAAPGHREERRREFERVGAQTTTADLVACDRFDVLDRLWEIRCRTQVLVGLEDVLTPPKYARTLADRISAARLSEYPGAGHMLIWDRPAEVGGELAVLWAATLGPRESRRADGPRRAPGYTGAGRVDWAG